MPIAGVTLLDLFEGGSLGGTGTGDEDDALSQLRATLTRLEQKADAAPVVIAIDDLQWIDTVSGRALLLFAAMAVLAGLDFVGCVRQGVVRRWEPLALPRRSPVVRAALRRVRASWRWRSSPR